MTHRILHPLAWLGLACSLSMACDAVVGDPDGTPTGDASTGPQTGPNATTADDPAPTGETTDTPGGTATTDGTTGSEPEPPPGGGSTGGGDPDTEGGASTGASDYPACLQPLLEPYHDSLGPCPGFDIIEYDFQGQQVFVFDSSQCGFFDQFFPVYNANCEEICLLYGFVGNTVCDGVEFYENTTEIDSWPHPA